MSINDDYQRIGERIARHLGHPQIAGMHLPTPVDDEDFRDEFGFVFLADGSVGPFYVSMGGMLQQLWTRYPEPARFSADTAELLTGFSERGLPERALALGAYNALSAALYRRAHYVPPDRAAAAAQQWPPAGNRVGMVGYFRPLVDRLLGKGAEVVVLERVPQRIPAREGITATTVAADLRACSQVLCTASTLVNDSLDELLATLGGGVRIELIGPSGSGAPDPLFARGIASVGGIQFGDRTQLLAQLAAGESWGGAGRKFEVTPPDYPGIDALLRRARPD